MQNSVITTTLYLVDFNLNVYDLFTDVAYLGCYNPISRDKYDVILTSTDLLSVFERRCKEEVRSKTFSHFSFIEMKFCLSGISFHAVYMENGQAYCPYNDMKVGGIDFMDVYAFKSKLQFSNM